jgi:hypothetical protein
MVHSAAELRATARILLPLPSMPIILVTENFAKLRNSAELLVASAIAS